MTIHRLDPLEDDVPRSRDSLIDPASSNGNERMLPEKRALTRKLPAMRPANSALEREMLRVYHGMIERVAPVEVRTALFVGPERGAGVSSIAYNFVRTLSRVLDKRTLYLRPFDGSTTDSASSPPYSYPYRPQEGWTSSRDRLVDGAMAKDEASFLELVESGEHQALLAKLQNDFDVIAVDAPPLSESDAVLSLSPLVSAIVVVVEADATSRRAARDLCDQIEVHGGVLSGVVLNKRRRYLPQAVERLLCC